MVGFLFLLLSVYGQTMEIQGTVTFFNAYPASNIQVLAKKAKSSVRTDSSGSFTLICNKKDVIVVQGKAFVTTSKNVDLRTGPLAFNLVFKDSPKNRDMVVRNGNISEANLLYGLQNLQSENNDYCSYEDIFSLIKSNFPEVEVKPSQSGGLGVYLRRGTKSMTLDTQMLYILDGMRTSSISYINPCEIAHISILGEGASAKYGAGSSNGALVIDTKTARR